MDIVEIIIIILLLLVSVILGISLVNTICGDNDQ